MRAGLTYLLTAVLVVHASLGCCWHTGQHCDACDDESLALSQPATCCKQHHDQRPHVPGPCKCRLECQGVCTVVCPKKMQVAKATTLVPGPSVVSAAILLTTVNWRNPELRADSRGAAGVSAPLRAHLLLCVLLI